MRRGYVIGADQKEKRALLVRLGRVDDPDHSIAADTAAPRIRNADWRKDFPGRAFAIKTLRPGDVLVVTDIMDLGTRAEEIIAMVAEIAQKGATIEEIDKAGKITYFSLPAEGASEIVALAERLTAEFNARRSRRALAAMRVTGKKAGPKGKLDALSPEKLAKAEAIWADQSLTREQSVAAINQLLPGRSTVTYITLHRRFGAKTAASEAGE